MSESTQPTTPETAIDLSDEERAALFSAGARLLRARGEIIGPDPNVTYINTEGQTYLPNPILEATIQREELATCGLPYDSLTLRSDEVDFDENGPKKIDFEVSRTRVQTFTHEGANPKTYLATDYMGVSFSLDPVLGIVVEEEGGMSNFYSDTDTVDTATVESGESNHQQIILSGPEMFVDDAEPLSRTELVAITTGLNKIT